VLGNIPPAGTNWIHWMLVNKKGVQVVSVEWVFDGLERLRRHEGCDLWCNYDTSLGDDVFTGEISVHGISGFGHLNHRVARAYDFARKARFEHGQSGVA
jgi:hypothetical protein